MRRRDILFSAAVTAVVGWSAGAQEGPKSARIGFIVTGELWPRRHFDEAMQRLGWTEGRNLTVERRVTGEDPERRKIAAAELVATNPDVIVAAGTLDAQTLLALTRTIPIVVVRGQDLVEMGLVNSLARPGGNVTGIVVRGEELDGKRLQLLRELIPAAARISVLGYTQGPQERSSRGRHRGSRAPARPAGYRETGERGGRIGRRLCRQCSRPRPSDVRAGQLTHIRESAPRARARGTIPIAGDLPTAGIR